MAIVIKKDGREENYQEEKLARSIRRTLLEFGFVNEKLVHTVLLKTKQFIKDKDYVLTKDLRNEVIKILATEDSSKVAKAYMDYVSSDDRGGKEWRP